jgi:hypothetical protein
MADDPYAKYGGASLAPAASGGAQADPYAKYGGGLFGQPPNTGTAFPGGTGAESPGGRFYGRIGENLNPLGIWNAITHLPEVLTPNPEISQEAADAFNKGKYGRYALSQVEALPLVGPQIRQGEEDIRSGNMAGLAGTAASLVLPHLAGKLPAAIPNVAGTALEDAATRQYSRVLGATTKPNKFRTAGLVSGYEASAPELGPGATAHVPGLIERGTMAVTRKGLQGKIQGTVADLSQQLENEWGKLSPDQGPPLNAVDLELNNRMAKEFMYQNPVTKAWSTTGPDATRGLAFMGKLREYLTTQAQPSPTGGQYIPWETLRRFRQDWDNMANAANAYSGGDLVNNVKAAGYTASANGLRQILNSGNPTISAINRELSFWKDAEKVIGDTMARTTSQAKPLGVKMARVAGQAVGFGKAGPAGAVLGGEAMDAIESTLRSPAWQTMSAVAKDRMAQAIATGNSNLIRRTVAGIIGTNMATPKLLPPPTPPPE